jgi:hypothetical protein
MNRDQTRERVLKAHRARLDESALRLDQLRRTYAEVPDKDYYDGLFMVLGDPAAELDFLRGRFGERVLVQRRTIEEVRADDEPIRVIGGRRRNTQPESKRKRT